MAWSMIIAVFAVLAIAAGAIYLSYLQAKGLSDTFARVAARRGGTCRAGGIGIHPVLKFTHRGAGVVVELQETGGKNDSAVYTRFHVAWPDRNLRCEVYPQRFFQRIGKLFGMQDIEIGSPAFDDNYMIGGDSPGELRRLLTPESQKTIDELRRLDLFNDDIYVAVRGGKMEIKKKGVMRQDDQLDRFITLALRLFDQWTDGQDAAIVFVDAPPSSHIAAAVCQICGEPIGAAAVYCRSCKTPHHEDCWAYFGACSTYGCGEKRFTRVGPQ